MIETLANGVGLIGVGILLAAYFLLQCGKISTSGILFSGANTLGAVFILFSLFYSWNLSSVVIETAWLFISLFGLLRALIGKKKV